MSQVIVDARKGLSRAGAPLTAVLRRIGGRREYRWGSLLVVLIVALVLPHLIPSDYVDTAVNCEVYMVLALGLNIIVGYAGLLDLGYAAPFAIGSLTMAWLASPLYNVTKFSFSSPFLSFGSSGIFTNFYVMLAIGALVAATAAVLIGAPTLRLRGDYLAIVTLAFGEIVPLVMQNLGPNNELGLPNITGGPNAISGIEAPPTINFLGIHADFRGESLLPWYYLGLAIVIFTVVVISSLRRSRLGRAWAAIREDEIAAAHMGINVTRTRLYAFALGAAFSGFAGVFITSYLGSVFYTTFSFNVSIIILCTVILGGMGSMPGVMLGGALLEYLDLRGLRQLSDAINNGGQHIQTGPGLIGSLGSWMHSVDLTGAAQMLFGIVLVVTMLLRPQGLWPSRTRSRELHPETSGILEEENVQLYSVRTE